MCVATCCIVLLSFTVCYSVCCNALHCFTVYHNVCCSVCCIVLLSVIIFQNAKEGLASVLNESHLCVSIKGGDDVQFVFTGRSFFLSFLGDEVPI